MLLKKLLFIFLGTILLSLSGCGFHLQGAMKLAPPFQKLYLQTNDPYGQLSRKLQQYLKMSNVQMVTNPNDAQVILVILQDDTLKNLLSVNGTQQTRSYNIEVRVTFAVTDNKGRILILPQALTESRVITVQSNQVLGSSNEASLLYQHMRNSLAYAIMNRLASKEISRLITADYLQPKKIKKQPTL